MLGQIAIERVVDARDKEAGHHADAANRFAARQPRANAAHIGFVGFDGLAAGKQQGQIDIEAV